MTAHADYTLLIVAIGSMVLIYAFVIVRLILAHRRRMRKMAENHEKTMGEIHELLGKGRNRKNDAA